MENADPLMIAVKLHRQGDLDGAENIYRAVLEVRPDNPDALRLMGLIARQRGDNNAAIGFLKKACAFQPLNAGFLVDYADALYAENRFDESAAVYERALTAEPGKAPTWYKSASANRGAGNCKAAMAHLLKAIECDPDFFDAYYNLGNCLREINAIDEALASFSEAKKLQPLSVPALSNYAEALQVIGRVDEAMECFRKAVSIAKERNAPAYSNLLLCMNYDLKYSPEEIYAEHARFGTLLSGIGRRQSFTGAMDPMPTLRLGYVSPDFCDHPVSRFIEPILMNHDRAGFEVYCYYGNARVDEVTRCLRLLPISWRNIHGVSDEDALTMIRDDRIDILVDLAGHTAGNRLPLFAQKPSPVQVSYCGYPNTTGLAEMDYYITDACLDSEKDAPLYTEKLLRVPDCFCCYMPPQNAPDIKDLPALTNRHISFGSLHPLTRLNVGVLNLWSAVLLAIPTARLLIVRDTLTNEAKKRLSTHFERQGVDPLRIDLLRELPAQGYLTLFHGIDITLDTHPWSGHTAACESLWMGVPVITLCGNRHAGRMASTILRSVGLPEWVARTEEDYCAIAVKAAVDIEKLRALRKNLRNKMAGSIVCDGAAFTRKLEAVFRKAWQQRCSAQQNG